MHHVRSTLRIDEKSLTQGGKKGYAAPPYLDLRTGSKDRCVGVAHGVEGSEAPGVAEKYIGKQEKTTSNTTTAKSEGKSDPDLDIMD